MTWELDFSLVPGADPVAARTASPAPQPALQPAPLPAPLSVQVDTGAESRVESVAKPRTEPAAQDPVVQGSDVWVPKEDRWQDEEEERERKRLRALINGSPSPVEPAVHKAKQEVMPLFAVVTPTPHAVEGALPVVQPLAFDPANPFRNAGLMRDIGGVKGFMQLVKGTHRMPEET